MIMYILSELRIMSIIRYNNNKFNGYTRYNNSTKYRTGLLREGWSSEEGLVFGEEVFVVIFSIVLNTH